MHEAKVDPPYWQSARNQAEVDRFNRTLFSALDALEENKIPYALIGGIASSGLGRPRSTQDIDVFVRPEDANLALEALEKKGFKTQKTDMAWLYKGFKEDILVDIIFKSRGDIYFDREMTSRSGLVEYHGRQVRVVSPEDLVIIKCVVHDEVGPHHWHDALSVLSHSNIDWDYLLKRARRAPRRLLSLLLYAQSNDIWVPNRVIFDLFKTVFGDSAPVLTASVASTSPPAAAKASVSAQPLKPVEAKRSPETYVIAHVREAIARDPRTGQQDIKVLAEGQRLLLRGEVLSEDQKKAIEEVAHDAAQDYQLDNQIKVAIMSEPDGVEAVG